MNIISRTKGFFKYRVPPIINTIFIGFVFLLQQSHISYGIEEPEQPPHLPSQVAFKHFEEDKSLIDDCLAKLEEAELHFFWTTGRTLTDNPAYEPDQKVDVGGSEYGQKFFPYVDKLLEASPDKLKVKFVCDTMTRTSNKNDITTLCEKYGNRFEILPIEKVQENLLKTFPLYASKIDPLFKNATQGNPVLVSDIYRVIGMVYGHDEPSTSDVTQKQYIYCDIDAFCYGMEYKPTEYQSHADLIKALFNPVTKAPFYFGRKRINNDLIKLQITEITPYKEFCEWILGKLNMNSRVFTHFSTLHDRIKQCEESSQICQNVESLVENPIEDLISQVQSATGPDFLVDHNITCDLSYPSRTVGEWGAPEEVLNYKMERYAINRPTSVLHWKDFEITSLEEEACKSFDLCCENYRKFLSAAFYARRFGIKHPFNIMIRKYLVDHFPYNPHATSFRKFLETNFHHHHKDLQKQYDLCLLEKLPKDTRPETGNMYLKKNGDKLDYIACAHDGEALEGTLDLNLDIENLAWDLRLIDTIEETLSQEGLMFTRKGLSYEDWKKQAFDKLTKPTRFEFNHFIKLKGVLWKLKISPTISLGDESLIDFQAIQNKEEGIEKEEIDP